MASESAVDRRSLVRPSCNDDPRQIVYAPAPPSVALQYNLVPTKGRWRCCTITADCSVLTQMK